MTTGVRAVELVVLLLAALPLVRILASTSFLRLFPRWYAAAAGALAAWGALVAVVAAVVPAGLHVLALLAGLGAAAALVRARPELVGRRGLPPGSLSVAESVRALADRRFYLRRAERHGPIFKAGQFHRRAVCVVGLERGHRLLRDHEDSIGSSPLPFNRDLSGGFLRYMDDETYGTYGTLFRRALTRPIVAAAAPCTAVAAQRELTGMATDCAAAGSAVRPGPYFERIVHDAFLRTLFGLDPGTDEHMEFGLAYRALAGQDLAVPLTAEAREALDALRGRVVALAGRYRVQGSDAPECSLVELARLDERMPDATCVDNLLFTLRVSSANVVQLLHWVAAMLGRHPVWAVRLRADPDPGDGGLPDRFVMETLRLAQSEYLYRVLTREVEFEGFRLPKGWLLRLCVWESHRSPETFAEPEAFDPDRFLDRTFQSSQYSPFGWASHACNGVALNAMICRVVLDELATGYEWSVSDTEPEERGFRHWHHWRPSSRLRLAIATVGAEAAGAVSARTAAR